MTEYHEQTSASDRIEAAREALANYDQTAETYRDGLGYSLADALRALITPPATSETEEDVAERIVTAFPSPYAPSVGYSHGELVELAITAYRAGIQSAHESWEPEVAQRPTQEQMLRWLGIRYTESAEQGYVYIPLQQIEREED